MAEMVVWMKDDRFSKVVLFDQMSSVKQKARRLHLMWEDAIKKDLKGVGIYWKGVKREALNTLGWKESVRSCVGLWCLGAAMSC